MQNITLSNGSVIKLYTPVELKSHLDEYIIGQDEAKRVISTAVYNHYKRLFMKTLNTDITVDKSNVILAGPSGCGKTAIIKCIADYMGIPYYIGDATSLTQAGYVGDDVESLLVGLLRVCDYDIEKAKTGIIFIDEVDKIAKRNAGLNITRDVVGEGVQQALLKIVEGSQVGVPPAGGRKHPEQPLVYIDTTDILFIGSGAFSGMEEIIKRRISPAAKIGFNDGKESKKYKDSEIFEYMSQEDLKEFGFIPEFIGRFPIIANINQLGVDELTRIVTEPKNSIVNQYAALLGLDDIRFSIEEDAIKYMAKTAIKLKTGARSLRTLFEDVLKDYMYELPGSDIHELIITKEITKKKLTKRYQTLLQKQ